MMALGEKQRAFARLVGRLLTHADTLGFQITLGNAFRSPEEAARLAALGLGIKNSLHTKRLALDINLFVDGVYRADTAAYAPLGEWWEAQSTPEYTCCWGGRFTRADGGHFSLEHEGVK